MTAHLDPQGFDYRQSSLPVCASCRGSLQQVTDVVQRKTISLALRLVYEEQRKHEGRNYAKEHSFEEWLQVP